MLLDVELAAADVVLDDNDDEALWSTERDDRFSQLHRTQCNHTSDLGLQ